MPEDIQTKYPTAGSCSISLQAVPESQPILDDLHPCTLDEPTQLVCRVLALHLWIVLVLDSVQGIFTLSLDSSGLG